MSLVVANILAARAHSMSTIARALPARHDSIFGTSRMVQGFGEFDAGRVVLVTACGALADDFLFVSIHESDETHTVAFDFASRTLGTKAEILLDNLGFLLDDLGFLLDDLEFLLGFFSSVIFLGGNIVQLPLCSLHHDVCETVIKLCLNGFSVGNTLRSVKFSRSPILIGW